MELWEGAVLIIGGIFLVDYMAKKNAVVQSAAAASTGVTNSSNLTNITNTAGGTPTTYGEPLEPPQPPLTPQSTVPTAFTPHPVMGPVTNQTPGTSPWAGARITGGLPARGTLARPVDIHL